jgi:D-alanyl-D-alanine carboxypeptidase (penicillin-binding protein 5/6)
MLRKTAIVLILAFFVHSVSLISADASETFPNIAATSALLVEKETGLVLFEHNARNLHPADNLTKMMTLLLAAHAVENDLISDNELIEMTEEAWFDISSDSTTRDIQPGEVMTFIDLMYSAYVGNANEACNMLAIRIAGSVQAFVGMMNAKAGELGAGDTRFVNAHGEYHASQITTAYDLFTIYSEALRSVLYREISGTYRHVTESIDESESRTMTNANSLLNQNGKYFYRNCLSGISSASFEGRHSLVAYAEEDGLSLISVVLGANVIIFDDQSTDMKNFSETQRLFTWAYTQFGWRDILRTTDLLARVPVQHGAGADFVNARPETSFTFLLNNSTPTDVFRKNVTIFSEVNNTPLIAPVRAGEVLGEVIITRDGVEFTRISLVANTDVELNNIEYIRRQIVDMLSTTAARNVIIVLVLLVAGYAALVIRYNILRINRLRSIRQAKEEIIRETQQQHRSLREEPVHEIQQQRRPSGKDIIREKPRNRN